MTSLKPLLAAALTLGSIAAVPAADAQRWGGGYDYQPYRGGYDQPYRGYDRDGYRGYDRDGYRGDYAGYAYRGDARYYDDRPRPYRRCDNGGTGAIVGALAGGLLGRAIDDRGDRALGTILGAGAGALAGHAIAKSNNPGYCR